MVECDTFPYLNLQDWIVHNIKVYAMNVGLEDEWYPVLKWLGDGGWDAIMTHEVNGKKLAEVLIDECIDDPFSRDEEEWEGYVECIVQKLEPLIKEIGPKFADLDKRLEEAVRRLAEEGGGRD
ncbi:MAG: hypothetical protein DRO39_07945 [Thermoprotei archaeon]|nr:MAG: hypothetical protein DRO39_07945 [Thermoprotei archaeon]